MTDRDCEVLKEGVRPRNAFRAHADNCEGCESEACDSGFVRYTKLCTVGERLFLAWFEGEIE